MKLSKIVFTKIVFLTIFASSAFAESFFPQKVTALLAKHKIWQTIPYNVLPVGSSYQNVPGIQKKWILNTANPAKTLLTEKTKLSIRPNAEGKVEWYSETIDLSAPINSERLNQTFQRSPPERTWVFEELGSDSFTMKSSDGSINFVFTPEKSGKTIIKAPRDLKNIHLATAPIGFSESVLLTLLPPPDNKTFLRHDLTVQKEIWIAPNFPKRYYSALTESLAKWNKVLGANLFQLKIQVQQINQDKCLASNALCMVWLGPEEIPWAGSMALTSMSFDPETGNIIGGIISFNNFASKKDLVPTPTDVITKAIDKNTGIKWVAEQYLNEKQYINYIHPFPNQLLEYFLIHEIGHFNGLNHNFAGTREGNFNHPTDSIMDYLPFPAVFKANEIGRLDRAMLDLAYRGQKPTKSYVYCDASHFTGATWVPGCDQRDLGDTLEWYNTLGELGPDGFLKNLTFIKPDLSPSEVTLAEMIAMYLGTKDGPLANAILCEHLDSKILNLLNERKIELDCN